MLPVEKKKSSRIQKKVVAPRKQTKKPLTRLKSTTPITTKYNNHLFLREKAQTVVRTAPWVVMFKEVPQLQLSEKTTTTMSLTSRGVGVLIACFGIWFSLYSANAGFSALTQTAQLTQIASTTNILPVIDCTVQDNFIKLECAQFVDKKPLPAVKLDGNVENLSGTVPVIVTVPNAQQVKMQILRADTGLIVTPFFPLNKTAETTWTHSFDTSTLDAGSYKVKVVVNNFYGGYDHIAPNQITKLATTPVQTAAGAVPGTTSTVTNTNLASTTVPNLVSGIKILSVTPDKSQSIDSFIFYIKTESADSVELEALHIATNKTYPIGNAEQLSVGNWRRSWNTNTVPLGGYRIRVTAYKNFETVIAPLLSVYKISNMTGTSTNVTATNTVITNPIGAPVTEIKELTPPVKIAVLAPTPLKGLVGLSIDVAHASSVALSIQPKNSLQFSPLGRTIQSGPTTWIYRMDSSIYPDGEYALKAVVRNSFGDYEFVRTGLIFKNIATIIPTVTETVQIEALKSIAVLPKPVPVNSAPSTTQSITPKEPATTTRSVIAPVPLISALPEPPASITVVVEKQLQSEFDKLSVSLRMEDTAAIEKITQTIETLKNSIATESDAGTSAVTAYIEKMITRTKENVERTNILITERTQQNASADFDKDLISDYDEVRLYRTNPFVADSDNDGFLDGVEIQSGYDPLDATPEVLVAYESPKETGVVREDILKVKSVTAAATVGGEATGTTPIAAALLSGYALPNSFITIYIYSTPIIITIKTESDGSWNYRLDKELEDGEHEVYIGVTDNAGKIVAKSARFAFVKRAEAFDGVVVDTPAAVTTAGEDRFFSGSAINLVLGISCIAIGLIFMLFGMNFHGRKPIMVPEPQP